jgi:N-acyl-D-amino-acid deacylase
MRAVVPGPGDALLLRGGTVADGTGAPARTADVLVAGGQVVRVAPGVSPAGATVVDVSGMVVMPGFVDAHVHADAAALDRHVQDALAHQGVTTVVVGQDGLSYAPSHAAGPDGPDAAAFARRYFAAVDGDHPTFAAGSVGDLLATYDGATSADVAYLVPHGTLRYAVMGPDPRPARPDEIGAMADLLAAGLDAGARGMSTGLEYAPACWAQPDELLSLCAVLASRGLPHVSHMRGYEDRVPVALAELLDLARRTGVATHVSHLHGPADVVVPLLDAALADGFDLTFDSYPYLRGASVLALVALPTWLPLADPDRAVALLEDAEVRARLLAEDLPARADVWPRVTLASVPHPDYRWAEGRRLVEVARELGELPDRTALRLLVATGLRVGCVFEQPPTNSAASVRALLRHPAQCAGSDGIYVGGHPHPRGWGTFARFLGTHVRELGDWDWGTAARHLAGTAAGRFGLTDRGVLRPGARADVVVLDPRTVADTATYAEPRSVARGVRDVLVAGDPVLWQGARTDRLPGRGVR